MIGRFHELVKNREILGVAASLSFLCSIAMAESPLLHKADVDVREI